MRLLRLLSVSILALSMGLIGADAQNLRRDNGPAETPPASFKGKQYVDSRGCVYIRAGYSGNVTWVPRVSRSRKVVCGQQPSLRTAAPAAPKAAVRQATAPRIPAGAKIVKRTTKVIPAPAKKTTRVVRKAAPVAAPKAQTRVVRKAAPKAQTRVVRRVAPTPAPQAQPRAVRTQVNPKRGTVQPRVIYRCGASEFSSQFINDGARCGPQTGGARSVVREEVSPQSSNQQIQGQRVGPKGANRRIAEARMPVPKGYKRAWDDDRLNPLRGVGTTSGKAQMSLVWSNTVPRHLIDPSTGKRATAKQKRILGIF
ncbi:hypothetical protein SAMN05444273_104254 [Litoreibacter ascidiaceicola]|uniref:Uncharacterized protein n=1 Tax=Litoreibacter ascidiaceicola TaxID=1486859 RepID=A0A1M4ZN40_9RHOB|nr:hypothetical protein [Litoreibacter ascidiaceicola]SHF19453.1 hypothetical protein SAMN05444273_104254 [Litoreibacter ascidiaceicola]